MEAKNKYTLAGNIKAYDTTRAKQYQQRSILNYKCLRYYLPYRGPPRRLGRLFTFHYHNEAGSPTRIYAFRAYS